MTTATNNAASNAAVNNNASPSAADNRSDGALLMPVNVIEDAAGITLTADMPGVPKDKLLLQIESGTLTIEGEMQLTVPDGTESRHAEVSLPRYRRVFTLSKELDADKVSAEFSQGVLRLHIPKADHAKPRKITVSVH